MHPGASPCGRMRGGVSGVSVVSVTGVSLGQTLSLSESICPTGSTLARQMTGHNPPVSRTFSMLVRQISDKFRATRTKSEFVRKHLSASYFPITLPQAQTASRTSAKPIILRSPGKSTNVGHVGILLPNPY